MLDRLQLKDKNGRELGPRQFEFDDFDRNVKLSPTAQRTEDAMLDKWRVIVDKARGKTVDEFVETDHPRGQPKNAGEFAAKGQQTAKSSGSQSPSTGPGDTPEARSPAPQRASTQTSLQRVEQVAASEVKGAPSLGADFVKMVRAQHSGDHPGMISPRLITAAKHVAAPGEYNEPTLAAMMQSPKQFHQIMSLVKHYPFLRINDAVGHPDEVAQTFINQAKDNILWLYDHQNPTIRERSKAWYYGARHIADVWSKKYNLPDTGVAGVIASLSPQCDWTRNITLAERVLDIYKGTEGHPAPAKTFRFSPEMAKTAQGMGAFFKKGRTLESFMGKRCDELADDYERGWWIRIYDETYNSRSYNEVTPEGHFTGVVKNVTGVPTKAGWMNVVNIAKAVHCIDHPDAASISKEIADTNKVRSFYNNILAPASAKGSVCIDTHAVAAANFRALAGEDIEVHHNFGTTKPALHANPKDLSTPIVKRYDKTPSTSKTGSCGTYGLYAEAYRRAAFERGVLPDEMQSVAWEAIRGLFSSSFKLFDQDKGEVDKAWNDYKIGKASINDTRQRVLAATKGIEPPVWVGSGNGNAPEDGATSYTRKLPASFGL